jgi:uncharacterized lipoprotein YajG
MKKTLIILAAIVFFSGCTKPEIEPIPVNPVVKDIFSVSQSNVTNAQTFNFTLKSSGPYTLTLIDSLTKQVVSRERIYGIEGLNSMSIYTKTIQSKYLHLVLLDANNNEIGKTTIITK